ncbi:hypothetical protein E2C01_074873 [Portunus trituberculatus]|uniref:Uncharacterized protein n=1 Tax=Portunus trituberculatus TaxID=210409 RepID=A0A5B7IFE8_PORTR|nr:hypothetical protein [Portunus trituberculatus]
MRLAKGAVLRQQARRCVFVLAIVRAPLMYERAFALHQLVITKGLKSCAASRSLIGSVLAIRSLETDEIDACLSRALAQAGSRVEALCGTADAVIRRVCLTQVVPFPPAV